MTHQEIANLHRPFSIAANRHGELGFLLHPIGVACRCDRIVIGMAHHPREPGRAVTGEHDVICLFHYLPRHENRVLHALQSGNRTDLRCV